MSATERDYYELLGVSRDADEREIKKAFRALARELHPDVSEHPEAGVRFREVSEAYEVLSNAETRASSTTATATPGCARAASSRRTSTSATSATSSPRSSATTSSAARGRRGGAWRGRCRREVEIDLVDAARGTTAERQARGRRHVRDLQRRRRRSPARTSSTCPRCGGAGRLQQVSRSVFGEFVRAVGLPRMPAARAARSSSPARPAPARGARSRSGRSRSRSRPGSTTASASASPARAMPAALGGRAGDVYVGGARPRRRALRARGQRHLLAGRPDDRAGRRSAPRSPVETLDGPVELEFDAGTQPGQVRTLRGQGMPVLQGFGRGDHRVLVNVTRAAPPQRRAAQAARGVRAPERRRRRTARTRASSRS